MKNEHVLASELSHFLSYTRDGRCVEVPTAPMPKVMESLARKSYASDVKLERGRGVFLLSPLELEEKDVIFPKNDLLLYETTNPATVSYDVWLCATKDGFKALAKRSRINGVEVFSRSKVDYADKLSEMEWVPREPNTERESEVRNTLFLYGVDSKTGNIRKFGKKLDGSSPLNMKGSIMAQFDVVDLSLVNQAIWKSREETAK